MTTTPEIIAALTTCDYLQLAEIRKALDERAEAIKAEFMAQAESMGLACHDNGKPKGKRGPKPRKEPE